MVKTKKQKIFSGIMLGTMIFVLLALTCHGLYALLVRFYGNTFWFIPVIGLVAFLYTTYMQYTIFRD